MRDLNSEMAAYIYQFMYLRRVQYSGPIPLPASLVTASFTIADALLAGKKPRLGDDNALERAILQMPDYARQTNHGRRMRMYNGVR